MTSNKQSPAPVLQLSGVCKSFKEVQALRDVSVTVEPGSLVALSGSDGAGKTTLLRIAAGLLRADSGLVSGSGVGGRPGAAAERGTPVPAGRFGYLSQNFSLYEDLSVEENLRFFSELYAIPDLRARREELLAMTGLTPFADRRAGRLSGGMKQKLALACALIHSPLLLLLDEPTRGVDPVSRREFWKLLTGLRASGVGALIATPYFDEAARCDTVVLLHRGRVLRSGDPETLPRELPGSFVEIVCEPVRTAREVLAADSGVLGVKGVQLFGDRVHVHFADARDEGVAAAEHLAANGVAIHGRRRIEPGLENLFIALMDAA